MTSILKNVSLYKIKNFENYKQLILQDLFFKPKSSDDNFEKIFDNLSLNISKKDNFSISIFSHDKYLQNYLIRLLNNSITPHSGMVNNKLSVVSLSKIMSGFNPKLSLIKNIKFKLLLADIDLLNPDVQKKINDISIVFGINVADLTKPLGNFDFKIIEDLLIILILQFKKDLFILDNFYGLNSTKNILGNIFIEIIQKRKCIFIFNKINSKFINSIGTIKKFYFLDDKLNEFRNLKELKSYFDKSLFINDSDIVKDTFNIKRKKFFFEEQFLKVNHLRLDNSIINVNSKININSKKNFKFHVELKCSHTQTYYGLLVTVNDKQGHTIFNYDADFIYKMNPGNSIFINFELNFIPVTDLIGVNIIPYISKKNYIYSHKIKLLSIYTTDTKNGRLNNIKLSKLECYQS